MIIFFRHNDILFNQRRKNFYRFDKNNIQHVRESGYCRLANFEEIKAFTEREMKFNETIIKQAHVWERGYSFGYKMDVPVEIILNDKLMSEFLVQDEYLKDQNYTVHVLELRKRAKDINPDKTLKEENAELRRKLRECQKTMRGFFNDLQNQGFK
jgi:hypothetical protein